MKTDRRGVPCSKALALLAFVGALLLGRAGLSGDNEGPILPPPGPPTFPAGFGGMTVSAVDTGGLTIDARQAIEPQITSLLIIGELADTPSGTLAVEIAPVLNYWLY